MFTPSDRCYDGVGAGVGLIFGIAIALLLEHLDTSVKSLEDVEQHFCRDCDGPGILGFHLEFRGHGGFQIAR